MRSTEVRSIARKLGADDCGVASIDRFGEAPKGFHPVDIYPDAKSVIVFLKRMPLELIQIEHPIPYSNVASKMYEELDMIGINLARALSEKKIGAVPVPCDTPYLHWDPETMHGRGILSMRHSGKLAGLGFLGKNTLLVHPEFGNMVYIGAVLTDCQLEPDPVIDAGCPAACRLCLDACPVQALDGITVDQQKCRVRSLLPHPRGFEIYSCWECRKACPRKGGFR